MNFGEKSFNELKRMTAINQVTLSKKLNRLKEEGYVTSKYHGIENHYFVTKKAGSLLPLIKDIEDLVLAAK
jgi:DNA-binding HxlR family transcriptional regulator